MYKHVIEGAQYIHTHILHALFPIKCIGCGVFDVWICDTCHNNLPVITQQQCPLCKRAHTAYGEVCFACSAYYTNSFDSVCVASSLHDPIVRKAIHYHKYRFVKDISQPLGLLMAQSLMHVAMPSPDMIIPIPLHARRMRWRGFNQAEEIARALDLRIPINTDILKRVRYTTPQVSMKNKRKRQQNLAHAFTVICPEAVYGKRILLIDDVMTTGATLHECAAMLKKSGAYSVDCLVITRE